MHTRRRQRIRIRCRRVAVVALVVGVVALAGVWLTFQHVPRWYQPPPPTDALIGRARSDAMATFDRVSDDIVGGKPFDVVLSQDAVNEWLAAAPRLWPDVQRSVPAGISEPAVAFEPDRIRLGARYSRGRWEAIVGVAVTVGVSDDGQAITGRLTGLQGGSLPLPRSVLVGLIDPLVRRAQRRGGTDSGGAGAPGRASEQDATSVDDVFREIVVPNRFDWPNGSRPFRILAIAVRDGELRVVIEPL